MGAGVVVLGSAHVDYTIYLDRLPSPGETLMGKGLKISPGGKGANQAVAAARLGAPTLFISRVGADDNGRRLLETLRGNGVDVSGVVVDEEESTGIALIMVAGEGENVIAVYPGTDARVSKEDFSRAAGRLEDYGAVLSQLEIPVETVAYAFELAGRRGLKRILNTAPYRPLPGKFDSLVDVAIMNRVEASSLLGLVVEDRRSAEEAACAAARRFGEAVVTMGDMGAAACSSGEGPVWVEAFHVEAVDAVAAGDAFSAAYTVGLVEGMGLEERLVFAAAAAAVKVTRKGAISGLPYRSEVESLVRAHG